uniref:Uncharacterized protein n=1 Tax=Rhizophora mucronata TaxID=61149 RepID=A0A2P2QW80_RHIMU
MIENGFLIKENQKKKKTPLEGILEQKKEESKLVRGLCFFFKKSRTRMAGFRQPNRLHKIRREI